MDVQTAWREELSKTEDIDGISEVFRKLFGNPPSHGSPYFKDTLASVTIPIDKLVQREAPDPERMALARERMAASATGTGPKRAPIHVLDMGNGKYKVLDGNTTLSVLLADGYIGNVVVEVKKSLKQQGISDPKNIDEVYAQAEKAQPLFREWAEKYSKQFGGKLMMRPGLKDQARAAEKVRNDYFGVATRLTDIVGGMIIFDKAEDVAAAYRAIVKDPAVFKAKNRFEKPTSDGYMDVLFVVNVGGHLCELQLNTESMLYAKEKGLGHKMYEVSRQLAPIAKDKKTNGEFAFTAAGYVEEIRKLSVKYYRDAAMSASSSSASNMASDSEIGEALDSILNALSASSISTHFDIDLPGMRNKSPVDRSLAKGTSSFSINSKFAESDINPPLLDISNVTRNGKKINSELLLGRPTRAYLENDRMLYLQYAVVEADELITSHKKDLTIDPEFPPELQPRDRKRDAMGLQVEGMANKLNPDRLGGSLQASTGSPIVGPDLIVESGNGRTIAIRKRYDQDGAAGYVQWLKGAARKLGFDPAKITHRQPVLVRIRTEEVNRREVAEAANKSDMAAMSPVEQARSDARNLTIDDMDMFRPGDDGNVLSSANQSFIKRFAEKLGLSQVAGLTTADGRPTKQMVDRIKSAVFEKAYSDERLLELQAEEANPDLKNITGALTIAASDFAKLKKYEGSPDFPQIVPVLMGAVKAVRESRVTTMPLRELLKQQDMFESISDDMSGMALLIDANIRSQAKLGRIFKSLAVGLVNYYRDRNQTGLFGETKMPTLKELIDNAGKDASAQRELFESAAIYEKSTPVDVSLWLDEIRKATSYQEIAAVFAEVFGFQGHELPGQEPPKAPDEYKGEDTPFGLRVSGIKAREWLNAQAKEILERAKAPEDLTSEDIDILKQYSGKGGLTENSQYEYYTPAHVAEGVWDALKANGVENGNILDPCTGAGVFTAVKPAGMVTTGVELDPTSARISQLLHKDDRTENKSFEKFVTETPDDNFDGIVGNVPFGDARGAYRHDDPAYKDEKRIERYFITRAIDKVKPGKLVCLVVPTNIVGAKGAKWEKFRIAISKKAEFLGAHKLPSKTFAAQGTDTVVDIVVFKKHPKELLEKVNDLPFETLKETNVVWSEFIEGLYWKGEGRRFIMGKYIPKVEGDRWSREVVDGDIDNAGLRAKLALKFNSRIDWKALEVAEPIIRNYADGDRRVINGLDYEFRNGEWVLVEVTAGPKETIDADKYGAGTVDELKAVFEDASGGLRLTSAQMFAAYKAFPDMIPPLHAQAIEFAMSQPKDEYREQIYRGSIIGGMIGRFQARNMEGEAYTEELARLQEIVVREFETYGHPRNNKGLLITGESSRMFGMFMNAIDEKGNFSDLLAGTKSQADAALQYNSSNLQSIVEHLFVREGIQTIMLEDVQKLYSGGRKIESLGDVAEDAAIAITPDGLIMPLGRYCAGDIYPKIAALTDAMANETDPRLVAKYQKQIDEILRRRTVTPAADITFGFRQKWVDRRFVIDFLKENGYPKVKYGRMQNEEIEDPLTGEKRTRSVFVDDTSDPFGEFYGIEGQGFPKQFLKYLNGGNVTSSGEDAQERIEEYKQQCRVLEERFNAWMQQHQDIDAVAAAYNRKFNGYLPFEYEETDLKLEGVSRNVKLHGFQNSAVRRMSEEGRGILAFDVGLGKTNGALALYAYNKQMGRSKKTCIVVPNAVLGNWYHSSKKFLGNHNGVLFVGFEPKTDKDGNIEQEEVLDETGQPKRNKHTNELEYRDALRRTDSREQIFDAMWKIPQGNHSLVIMTKEKFGMIPMRSETKAAYTDKMVDRALISDKMADATVKENSEGKSAVSYQGAKDKERLEGQFSDEGTAKKGELPFFEDMGFTDVIVDECHHFKNSYQAGENTQNIAYLPTAPSAKCALDMALKMNFIRDKNNGRGAYGLSATPVTNSPFEIYNMLSLVCPMEEFERFGVYTVDDFVRVFGRIESVDKVKVSGDIVRKDGMVGFNNLSGLRNLFHKYINLKNAKDVNLPLPPHEEDHQEVEMTDDQKRIYEGLREDARDAAKPGSKVSMFSVIRDMDRVTTDMDLYKHTMTFVFPARLKNTVDDLVGKLPKEHTVTFKDEETGEKETKKIKFEYEATVNGDSYILEVPESYEDYVVSRFPEFKIDVKDVAHPVTPKYAKMIENLRSEYEQAGKQLIFTEEKSQHNKIKRIITHHLPVTPEMIGIINAEEAAGAKLEQISSSYNSGSIKIIVANKKAEVGVNLQKGTTAIHHLTLPWTPASIQQRNGRGVRQGNRAERIRIYYYLGKGSFDNYRLDLLQKKSNWMRDLFFGKSETMENANAFDQNEFIDMLEADPEAAKAKRIERLAAKEAERREVERKRLANELLKLSQSTALLSGLDAEKEKERVTLQQRIQSAKQDIERWQAQGKEMEDGEEKRALGGKIIDRKKTLVRAEENLNNIDTRFEQKRSDLTNRVKQTSILLKGKAAKGELPFDEKLVEHPEKAVVTLGGDIIAVGDTYEIKDTHDDTVVKIIDVNPARRAIGFEYILGTHILGGFTHIMRDVDSAAGDNVTMYDVKLLKEKKAVKVSYSEAELSLKKLLSEELTYKDLIDGKVDKDTFYSHINEIHWGRPPFIMRDQSGALLIDSGYGKEGREKTVYPEPKNEDFRKAVCEVYLRSIRAGAYFRETDLMEALFGAQWQDIALGYGKKATESEIRSMVAVVWEEKFQAGLKQIGRDDADAKARVVAEGYRFANDVYMEMKDLGDNKDEIEKIVSDYCELKRAEIGDGLVQFHAEKKKAEMEAVRNDPNFKEVPEDIRQAFEKMGITIKTNMARVVFPGRHVGRYKKYGDASIEPFSQWFLQDKDGKGGRLYRTKDILKARFGAKFGSDGGDGFKGAWWYVSSKFNLKDVYEVIA